MAGFCGACGKPLADDSRFCEACGQPVAAPSPASMPSHAADPLLTPTTQIPAVAPHVAPPAYGQPVVIPAADALPPRPAMSRKAIIVMVCVVAAIGLGYLGFTVLPPMLTSPAAIADQLVKAADSGDDTAVAAIVAPALDISSAGDASYMLDAPPVGVPFKVESQAALSAVVRMQTEQWTYRLTVAREWNGPWRVSRIELSRDETGTETVSAPTDSEYVDWDLWPSSQYEVTVSQAQDGERTYTTHYTMIDGVSDEQETGSSVTLKPVASKVLRGTGPALDTYGTAYSAYEPTLSNDELSLSMRVAIDPTYGDAAPKGAKLQAHIRTPDGQVVDSEVLTNSGKADPDSYYYMTTTWNWTPALLKEKGATGHPTDEWLPGVYAIVYTSNDVVVGANYWEAP